MTTTTMTRQEMESRRLEAAGEILNGKNLSVTALAEKYGVSRESVYRWTRKIGTHGSEGLKARRASGRPNRLSPDQRREIVTIYLQGSQVFGWEEWTWARLAVVISDRFGVQYDASYLIRLVAKLGIVHPRAWKRLKKLPELREAEYAATV